MVNDCPVKVRHDRRDQHLQSHELRPVRCSIVNEDLWARQSSRRQCCRHTMSLAQPRRSQQFQASCQLGAAELQVKQANSDDLLVQSIVLVARHASAVTWLYVLEQPFLLVHWHSVMDTSFRIDRGSTLTAIGCVRNERISLAPARGGISKARSPSNTHLAVVADLSMDWYPAAVSNELSACFKSATLSVPDMTIKEEYGTKREKLY